MDKERAELLQEPREVTPNAYQFVPNLETVADPELRKSLATWQDPLYQDIQEVGGFSIHDNKVFAEDKLAGMEQEIRDRLVAYDQKHPNAYHNSLHAESVLQRVKELIGLAQLSEYEAQTIRVSALFHDAEHSGAALRQDGWTNEEAAALAADQYLKDKGFSLYQRLLARGHIIGTRFPDGTPFTPGERLLAIADVGGFKDSWAEGVQESARVLQEVSPQKRQQSLTDWLAGRKMFLQHVRLRMTPEAERLWGERFEERVRIVDRLIADNNAPEMDVVRKEIGPLLRPLNSYQVK